jgi:hypothetical protein
MKPGAVHGLTPVACKWATGSPDKEQIKRWRSQNVMIESQKKTSVMYCLFSSFSTIASRKCWHASEENPTILHSSWFANSGIPKNLWFCITRMGETHILHVCSHVQHTIYEIWLGGMVQRNQEKFRTSETKRLAQKCASIALMAAVAGRANLCRQQFGFIYSKSVFIHKFYPQIGRSFNPRKERSCSERQNLTQYHKKIS